MRCPESTTRRRYWGRFVIAVLGFYHQGTLEETSDAVPYFHRQRGQCLSGRRRLGRLWGCSALNPPSGGAVRGVLALQHPRSASRKRWCGHYHDDITMTRHWRAHPVVVPGSPDDACPSVCHQEAFVGGLLMQCPAASTRGRPALGYLPSTRGQWRPWSGADPFDQQVAGRGWPCSAWTRPAEGAGGVGRHGDVVSTTHYSRLQGALGWPRAGVPPAGGKGDPSPTQRGEGRLVIGGPRGDGQMEPGETIGGTITHQLPLLLLPHPLHPSPLLSPPPTPITSLPLPPLFPPITSLHSPPPITLRLLSPLLTTLPPPRSLCSVPTQRPPKPPHHAGRPAPCAGNRSSSPWNCESEGVLVIQLFARPAL